MSLKNDYAKQQRNNPKTLMDMYKLMVVFELTRATPVARGRNEGLNFENMVADSKETGTRDTGGGGAGRKMECWKFGGGHLKRNCPKYAKEKEKERTKKYEGGKWCIRRASNKGAEGKTEVKGGQLGTMFTSSVDSTSGGDFSDLGEGENFTWHQFHVEGWVEQDFEGHAPVTMHNYTGRAVTLTWILLNSQ